MVQSSGSATTRGRWMSGLAACALVGCLEGSSGAQDGGALGDGGPGDGGRDGGASVAVGTGVASCDQVSTSATSTVHQCTEYTELTDVQVAAIQRACMPRSDPGTVLTYRAAPCERAATLGGCRTTTAGLTQTVWHYPGALDAMTFQRTCVNAGWVWITP